VSLRQGQFARTQRHCALCHRAGFSGVFSGKAEWFQTASAGAHQHGFVAGQVKSPGAYAAERGTTVLQVLSLAGGLTDRGAEGRIKILRTVKDKQTEIKAKLTDTVEPGDTIVVPERFF